MVQKKSSISPYEGVGVVCAQSIGEPGTQMCLSSDERIIIKHNGAIAIVPIGEFTDIQMKKFGYNKIQGYEVCDLRDTVEVLSLAENEKVKWKKVLSCNRHRAPARLISVETVSGRKIIATDFHSFITRKNNKIISIAGKELRKGDRIPSIKYLPENCIHSVETYNLLPYFTPENKTALPSKMRLNGSLGCLIGAYLSNGSLSKSECLPQFVYSANQDFVAALLKSYFDESGDISVEKRMIRVSSNSEELIDGIKLLLTRFKIFAHKTKDKKQISIIIPYTYAPIFLEKIGSDIKNKKERLEKLAVLAKKSLTTTPQDYADVISGFDDLLCKVAKKIKYSAKSINSFTKKQKIERTTLLHYIKIFSKLGREKKANISHELNIMRRMYNSDVVWDEIKEIRYIRPAHPYVYDLSVEGAHTFTTFDGIVTHNTMRTFHYAGVAEHVPTGLPRLIEIVDAKKEPKKPISDIYLKREYGRSQSAAEKIANEISSVTVDDIADVVDELSARRIVVRYREKDGKALGITFGMLKKSLEEYEEISKSKENSIIIIPKKKTEEEKEITAKYIRKMANRIKGTVVRGIKGLSRAVVLKGDGEYFIRAAGYNIEDALTHYAVDQKRIYTNNIKKIEKVFGIEAARNAIVKEIKDVMDMQKLYVDIRHIMLVADAMTFSGEVKSIGRHGLGGEKVGVLGRAAFEETLKHLITASASAEDEHLVGVTENIIVGQIVPIGTGKIKLIMKRKKK